MEEFIKNFAELWEETDPEVFTPELEFRELEEWSSIIGIATLSMINLKYGVSVSATEFMKCPTVGDIYRLVESKK